MKVELINNRGKQWNRFGSDYVKGFAFIGGQLLNASEIYAELISAIETNTLRAAILNLNGNFSAIITYDQEVYLFADKLKTYPLLYAMVDGQWLITDQSTTILSSMSECNIDDTAVSSYLASGYLYGSKTFLKNCSIVSAGTYVVLNNKKATVFEYHKHIYEKRMLSDKEIMDGCVSSMENAIKRMVISVGDRPIWLPLSGGYDSRLLACIFKKLNVPNVKCFTYGVSGSYEIKISEQVAKSLGFPWYCVEYTKEKFLSAINDPQEGDYLLWGMNLNTTAHLQDFIAFKELREKGLIEDNAVIVPGHSGEILGRDQVPYDLLHKGNTIAELIYHKYFQWNIVKKKYRKAILTELGYELNSTVANENRGLAIDLFTNWNIQNRQSNFIVNAVRVYEFFGVDWRVPLWDDELSKFWFSLNYTKNSNVVLYNKFLFDCYFIPMNLDFYKKKSKVQSFVAKIRLPFGIKDMVKTQFTKFKYFKLKYDLNGLNEKTNVYLERIVSPSIPPAIQIKYSNANAVLAAYQISLIYKYLNNSGKIYT